MDYETFVARKLTREVPTGLSGPFDLPASLFAFQRDLTSWALRRGRAAIFAGTGLGKSRMSLSYAREIHRATGRDVLVLAPLGVTRQMAGEGRSVEIGVTVARTAADLRPGINVTNYDRLHHFDASRFGAVVLDESSLIKHHDAKTFKLLCDAFRETPFKLCCTATPAPNDFTELGTHAEFLGVCTRVEMLSEFFVHDGGDTQTWRLKGHARAAFWRWVASWAALVQHPRDLGYEQDGYDLPPLHVHEHTIAADSETVRAAGLLFAAEASTLMERRQARKASLGARTRACADVVAAERDEKWAVWCDLNAEQDALADAFGDECSSVYGSLDADEKEKRLDDWLAGRTRILLSKSSILGFGLNLQCCARTAFVGVTDSYEAYYQTIRRFWRFKQLRPVHAHVFASEAEGAVVANLKRKDADATELARALAAETAAVVRAEVRGLERTVNDYSPTVPMTVPAWLKTEEDATEEDATW